MSRQQAEVLDELEEWREDVRERGIGSRVVLLAAPEGWGRSAVLARFRDFGRVADGPVTMVAGMDGSLPGDRAVQAAALQKVLAVSRRRRGLLSCWTWTRLRAGRAGPGRGELVRAGPRGCGVCDGVVAAAGRGGPGVGRQPGR